MINTDVTLRSEMQLGDVAKALSGSGFFSDTRSAQQAVVKVLAGQEMGVGPVAAMRGIHFVQGALQISSALMAAMIKRSGHYRWRVVEHTDERCELRFEELSSPGSWESIGTSAFTLEEAKRAGLVKPRSAWEHWPRNMLFARALSNAAKWFCPELFGGAIYTEGDSFDRPPRARVSDRVVAQHPDDHPAVEAAASNADADLVDVLEAAARDQEIRAEVMELLDDLSFKELGELRARLEGVIGDQEWSKPARAKWTADQCAEVRQAIEGLSNE